MRFTHDAQDDIGLFGGGHCDSEAEAGHCDSEAEAGSAGGGGTDGGKAMLDG